LEFRLRSGTSFFNLRSIPCPVRGKGQGLLQRPGPRLRSLFTRVGGGSKSSLLVSASYFTKVEMKINPRNAPFFNLYENITRLLLEEVGEKRTYELMRILYERGLSVSYGTNFKKGDPKEFARVLSLHDDNVGLHVEFPEVTDKRIVYQMLDDPFPHLKGVVDPYKNDFCYMDFKINYVLGPDWTYTITKHLWNGDSCIEHVIVKK